MAENIENRNWLQKPKKKNKKIKFILSPTGKFNLLWCG
jgi:hypothetical protein